MKNSKKILVVSPASVSFLLETAARMCRTLAMLLVAASSLHAQVKPNASWRTIKTEHFYVHFTPELETVARQAAAQAETSYVELSRHLHPPRGKIDVVISDDVDFTNGYATPFPSNRIVVYATPPAFESALRFTDDPVDLVVTHELTHIFHLDRVGGVWKVLQSAFGRYPLFFPSAYKPSWLVEGLAVYYESQLTGGGRIESTGHRMIARTAALERALPRLDQLSLANPYFPYGYSVYAYGSLFMDYLARTHGDTSMKKFVESSSRQLIPLYLNGPAKRAFGKSFNAEYSIWAESVLKAAPPWKPPMPGWRDVTVDGAYASFARWVNDSTLVYTGTPGRESYGAYKLTFTPAPDSRLPTPARRERIGRRNSRSPNAVLRDGSLLYSQLEYANPYTIRSDLYVDRPRGGTQRLTHGARLALPDARGDGLIAAVNIVPAGTRIALVSVDGRHVTPITSGGMEEQWSEPRWSPDGKHIAAIRWTRGGTSEVLVIDTTGRIEQTLIRERVLNLSPSWSLDGRYVYFSSDRTGISNLYRVAFAPSGPPEPGAPRAGQSLELVSDAQTGLFEPQPSPAGRDLAATVLEADGYHIGIVPLTDLRTQNAEVLATVQPREPVPSPQSLVPSSRYSPWRSLLPRYWLPLFASALGDSSTRYGVMTSGEDVIGRHAYQARILVPDDNSGITGWLFYRNARLGQPLIDVFLSQDWENYLRIVDQTQQGRAIGMLRRRIRDATLALAVTRPRARSFSYVSLGGGVEARDYAVDSLPLLTRIDSAYRRSHYYPRVVASLGWSNTQRPLLAISPEDGISLASTTRVRWRTGDTLSPTVSFVGSTAAFKSLDLPGFAHHVIALRAAGGVQDNRGTGFFEVGGVSGGLLDLLPGYTLGEGRRTFSVRGFPAASLLGIRAFAGSAEYRAPFTLPGRGLRTLPFFLDRTSITLFGDVGSAWCPALFVARPTPSTSLCTQSQFDNGAFFLEPHAIGSAGAELGISAAVLSWDTPFRFRFGLATPVVGQDLVKTNTVTTYFTVGVSF